MCRCKARTSALCLHVVFIAFGLKAVCPFHCLFSWKLHLIRFFFVQLELNRYLCARSLEELRALSVCAAPDGCSHQGLFIANLQKNTVITRGLLLYFLSLFLTIQRYEFFPNYARKNAIILYRKALKINDLGVFN